MNREPRRPDEDGVERTCAQRHGERDQLTAVPMESSGAEEQASESVDSAGVTVMTDQPAVPVSTDDPEGETDSAVTTSFEEATVVSGRSRVCEAEDSIAELTQLLDNARKLSAELETDENDGVRSCSAAMDKVLRDEIEVSDVCLAEDPEEDLRLRHGVAGRLTPNASAAEAASAIQRSQQAETTNQLTQPSPSSTSKFEADHRASAESDPLQDLVNGPDGDMFTNGETDESALTPVFKRRSFVDDICFGGATFDECLATLSRL
ncbi:hypothetical protein PF006_g31164, partial [Phytophthora fragariae]